MKVREKIIKQMQLKENKKDKVSDQDIYSWIKYNKNLIGREVQFETGYIDTIKDLDIHEGVNNNTDLYIELTKNQGDNYIIIEGKDLDKFLKEKEVDVISGNVNNEQVEKIILLNKKRSPLTKKQREVVKENSSLQLEGPKKLASMGVKLISEIGEKHKSFLTKGLDKKYGKYVGYTFSPSNNELAIIQEKAITTFTIVNYDKFPEKGSFKIIKVYSIHK